jgi:hypothetical protein
MGFFSWTTADTNESIPSVHSNRSTQTVYLLQPNGRPPIEEECYEGYGVFGGQDAYEWLARQNAEALGIDLSGLDFDDVRSVGIEMFFDMDVPVPLKFSFNPKAVYEDLPASESCPNQGFFYDDDEEEDDDENPFIIPDGEPEDDEDEDDY